MGGEGSGKVWWAELEECRILRVGLEDCKILWVGLERSRVCWMKGLGKLMALFAIAMEQRNCSKVQKELKIQRLRSNVWENVHDSWQREHDLKEAENHLETKI